MQQHGVGAGRGCTGATGRCLRRLARSSADTNVAGRSAARDQSAHATDIWRGAVEAIPFGQWEASAALGLTRWRQLRQVILPQAFTIAIPPTVGFLVQLIKNTSLASVIGVVELSREAQLVNGATFAPFLVYLCVCVLYFGLCYPLTAWSRTLEARLAR